MIVEGETDAFILSALAGRIIPRIQVAKPLIYHGRTKLRRSLDGYLAAYRFGVRQGAQPILHLDIIAMAETLRPWSANSGALVRHRYPL